MKAVKGDVIKFRDQDDGEAEKWENGTYGQDPETAKAAPKEVEKEIDDALGLMPITLRLQKSLVEELKKLATDDGLGYQPYVRRLLTQHVKEKLRTPVAH